MFATRLHICTGMLRSLSSVYTHHRCTYVYTEVLRLIKCIRITVAHMYPEVLRLTKCTHHGCTYVLECCSTTFNSQVGLSQTVPFLVYLNKKIIIHIVSFLQANIRPKQGPSRFAKQTIKFHGNVEHATVLSPTLAHGNSKNKIRKMNTAEEENKQSREQIERRKVHGHKIKKSIYLA